MTITRVRTSLIDTASLCCALKSNHELVPPEGGVALSDALVLVDCDCPQASKLCIKSKLVGEIYTSVVLARDLNMYTGNSQRVALHAHAFASLVKPKTVAKVYKEKKTDLEAMLKRNFLGKAYQCAECRFGPIDHMACGDLDAHHGEQVGRTGKIDNSCPKCGWFSFNIEDWPEWDGTVPAEMFEDKIGGVPSSSLKSKVKHGGDDGGSSTMIPSTSSIEVMLRILYSARSVMGYNCCKDLVSKLSNWEESITAADGVDHPYQLALAIACLCDEDEMENVFADPPLLMLINEQCSRSARDVLNMKFSAMNKAAGGGGGGGGGSGGGTAVVAGSEEGGGGGGEENLIGLSRTFVTKLLGITSASAPEAKGLDEAEPPMAVVRESCCGDFNINKACQGQGEEEGCVPVYDEYGYEVEQPKVKVGAAAEGGGEEEFDFENFVNESVEPILSMLLFCIALRKVLKERGGGWTRLEQDMETGMVCYQDVISALTDKKNSLLKFGPTALLDALLCLEDAKKTQVVRAEEDEEKRMMMTSNGIVVDLLVTRIRQSNEFGDEGFKGKQRMLATMTAQGFLHYNSSKRRTVARGGSLLEPLGDVRDGQTLRNLAIDLRMLIYQRRVGAKMRQWKSVGSDIVVAKARAADIGQYMDMLKVHAHGLDKPTFWGLWDAARSEGPAGEKVKFFLSKANEAFALAHA
jgi:hypothetical protein